MPSEPLLGLPWQLEMDEAVTIRDAGGSRLLAVGMRQSENFLQLSRTQYRYMVKAINMHAQLLEELEKVTDDAIAACDEFGHTESGVEAYAETLKLIEEAKK